ncbi:MAG: hypothetical protein AAGC55_06225, partial [Myxococcota bacterium]
MPDLSRVARAGARADKDSRVRLGPKIQLSFLAAAAVTGIVAFVGQQLAIDQLTAQSVPILQSMAQAMKVSRDMMGETIEFVVKGDDDSASELAESAAQAEDAAAAL